MRQKLGYAMIIIALLASTMLVACNGPSTPEATIETQAASTATAETDTTAGTELEEEYLIVLPGTIQGALGGEDWDPAGEVTKMDSVGDDVYEFTATLPQGTYEYKVAVNGSWEENYGWESIDGIGVQEGPNIMLEIPADDTEVRIVFDYAAKTLQTFIDGEPVSGNAPAATEPEPEPITGAEATGEELVVLPGTIQSILGGENWDPASEMTQMDYVGDGIFEFAAQFPKGTYEYKVAINGTWDENYGREGSDITGVSHGPNIILEIPENDFQVRFVFDYNAKTIQDSVNDDIQGFAAPDKVAIIGLPEEIILEAADDGTYAATADIPVGEYQYQVQYNDNDLLTYGARGVKQGSGIALVIDQDTAVTFILRIENNIVYDTVNYIEIPEDRIPTLTAEGMTPLILTDDDYDNIYEGLISLPKGKATYTFNLMMKDETAATTDFVFNEIADNYPVIFSYNHETQQLSHDYIEQLSAPDGQIVVKSLYYNSQDTQYKQPYGAAPDGTTVTFVFSSKANDLESVNLIFEIQKITGNYDSEEYLNPETYPMTYSGTSADGTRDFWTVEIPFDGINVYAYYFEAIDGDAVAIYGNNSQVVPVPHSRVIGTGGVGEYYAEAADLIRYTQTVYDPDFTTPDWAKDVIFYYTFPERFRNGDAANDPQVGTTLFYNDSPIEVHDNWTDEKPWVPGESDDNTTDDEDWCNDFYGGDLDGIIEKLDYLADLGINTLYLNPIFEAPSNHKYDTADYLNVDDNFGGNEAFDRLIAAADERGIRIILDVSLNHSGSDSVYMDRYGKYDTLGAFENEEIRQDSPYYNWYEFNPDASDPDQMYNQWGNPTLANLQESDDWKEFAFGNSDSVTQHWLAQGASGWRMDVTPWVSDEFWREWRTALKSDYPDAFTVAETWFDSSKYLLGDMFDSTMNYIFRTAMFDYANGGSAHEAVAALEMMRENYPQEAFYSLMNLLSTHDASRALYVYGYTDDSVPETAIAEAKQKLLLAAFFQMTYPGAPAIFYGDEVGVTGGEDPFNRGPYPWADQGGTPDTQLLESFKTLIEMRNEHAILRRGSLATLYTDAHTIVMLREYEGELALVAVNNAAVAQTIELDLTGTNLDGQLTNLLTGDTITVTGDTLSIEVPPTFGSVWITDM